MSCAMGTPVSSQDFLCLSSAWADAQIPFRSMHRRHEKTGTEFSVLFWAYSAEREAMLCAICLFNAQYTVFKQSACTSFFVFIKTEKSINKNKRSWCTERNLSWKVMSLVFLEKKNTKRQRAVLYGMNNIFEPYFFLASPVIKNNFLSSLKHMKSQQSCCTILHIWKKGGY